MKFLAPKTLIAAAVMVSVVALEISAGGGQAPQKNNPRAEEAWAEGIPPADLGDGFYRNPVLGPGSDNTLLKVGSDYYMMAGGGWPDQLIWHSRDLVNWAPVVRTLRKFDGGAWASDLTYYKGKYYIYTTQMDPSRGNVGHHGSLTVPVKEQGDKAWKNIVMWADHIEGPWSDPIDIGVYGLFDPGHVVDQQGNRYLYFNKGMIVRLSPDGLSAVGELRKVYDGWDYPKSWLVSCKCLEAPKLIFHNGYYYMTSAEGGTDGPSIAHMSVVARSKAVDGPWENSPYNPLVHTGSSADKWWRQGHGTFVEDEAGKWWFMYTGFENGYELCGKQSLLLPLEWTADGWPRVPFGVSAADVLNKPAGENVGHGMPLSDDFSNATLGIQWLYDPSVKPEESFRVGEGELVMKAQGNLTGRVADAADSRTQFPSHATMLGVMALDHSYEAEVEVTIPETAEGGLLLSSGRGETGTWASVGLRKGELFRNGDHKSSVESKDTHLFLRLRDMNYDISAFYSQDGKNWTQFENASRVTDGRRLSLYAAGAGDVVFRNFKYHGLD
jgi:xylan 1,4-beta-xylosidase